MKSEEKKKKKEEISSSSINWGKSEMAFCMDSVPEIVAMVALRQEGLLLIFFGESITSNCDPEYPDLTPTKARHEYFSVSK